jgi:hypothetical protein
MGRKLYLWIGTVVFALYLGFGFAWSVANLSDIPHYGDTLEYLGFARDSVATAHRGFLYPWLITGTEALCVEGELPGSFAWASEQPGDPCTATSGLVCLQILQILVCGVCLAYFAFVVVGHRSGPANGHPRNHRLVLCLVPAALLLDPLVNHFNFSLMSDGLAFSASLAFCAALADLAFRRTPPWTASAVLLLSYLVASGLRVEKRWTLLATLVGSLVVWRLLRRTAGLRLPAGRLRWLSVALGSVCLGLILVVAVQKSVLAPSFRMPILQTALHFRLVFPHLSDVYEELPQRAKRLITPRDASLYDEHVNNPPKIMYRVTRGDKTVLRYLTTDLVQTVFPEKWPLIVLDFIRDSLENLLGTASFYVRVIVSHVWPGETTKRWFFLDAAVWDYERLVFHHPRLSVFYIASSLVLLALAAPIALSRTYRYLVGASRSDKLALVAVWTPALLFWVLNAVSFAAYINITNVRYVIFSHSILLAWIYAAALPGFLARDGGRARHSLTG